MNIALFYNTPSGGAKRAIYEWVRRLSRNHLVDVYTLSTADHSFCDIRPYVHSYRVYDFIPHKLYDSPFGRLNQLQRWRDLGQLTQIGKSIASEINYGDYDVVFANTCMYTFIPTFLQFVRRPSLYYLHEPFGHLSSDFFQRSYEENNSWRKNINGYDPFIRLYKNRLKTIQQNSVISTTKLLANSDFTKDQMKLRSGVDATVCHLGVDFESFRPIGDTTKENDVISVGELSPRKGFDFIVESLGCIPMQHRPRLKLICNMVIASEKAYVEALARKFNVDMEILTNLDTEELAAQYSKARLCVYAPNMEPFGLVPLESMSCGTPVVGVKEGGVQESVNNEQTGVFVYRDAEQFASAIAYLLSDLSLAEQYGHNGREHILQNWTWDRSTAMLEKHLRSSIL